MLDEIDRRAEQEGIATNTLRKYQIKSSHKPMLYNSIARAGEMPATIIKKKITRQTVRPKHKEKKQIPVFNLEG